MKTFIGIIKIELQVGHMITVVDLLLVADIDEFSKLVVDVKDWQLKNEPSAPSLLMYFIMHAISNRGQQKILHLLSIGADVHARTKDGRTAIHYAVRSKFSTTLIPLLLQHGAELDARDSHGNTALTCAYHTGGLAEARLLVQVGASLNIDLEPRWAFTPNRKAVRYYIERVRGCVFACQRAVFALILSLKKKTAYIEKNVAVKIARFLWTTRRHDVWEAKCR